MTLFRTKYTVEVTSLNKYAIAMFFNRFLDDLNDSYKAENKGENNEFQNFYFYLKY